MKIQSDIFQGDSLCPLCFDDATQIYTSGMHKCRQVYKTTGKDKLPYVWISRSLPKMKKNWRPKYKQ